MIIKRAFNRYGGTMTIALSLGLTLGCGSLMPTDESSSVTPEGIFILCEGAWGANNASLWHINSDLSEITPTLHANLTGMPLGDTGQSLYQKDDRLYALMNSSNTMEVYDLSADTVSFSYSMSLPGAGPREMVIVGNEAFITAWGVNGLLVVDLVTRAVTDTIGLGGLPEDILAMANDLYIALPLKPDFSTSDRVYKVDAITREVVDTLMVGNGPQQLMVKDSLLYISRQWYDATWSPYRGLSTVIPETGEVIIRDWGSGGGLDIFFINDQIYAGVTDGVVQVDAQLGRIADSLIPGTLPITYVAGTDGEHILIGGYGDFSTPGELAVYQTTGQLDTVFTLGIGPSAIINYRR